MKNDIRKLISSISNLLLQSPGRFFGISLLTVLALSGCTPLRTNRPIWSLSPLPSPAMDADTQRNSGVLHSFLVGQMALHNDDNQLALEEFSKASLNSGAPSAEIHGRLADLYIKSGQLEKAKIELEAALEVDPDNGELRLNYAGVLESLGDTGQAAEQYEVVLKTPGAKLQTYIMLASLYAQLGDFDRSIKVLKRLLDREPNETLAHYYLGRIYEQAGNDKRAIASLKIAYADDPTNEEYLGQLLRILIKVKDTTSARRIADEVVNKDPTNVVARRVLSQLSLSDNKIDDAISHLKVLGESEDDPSTTRLKIALLHVSRNDFDLAVRELQLILASNPDLGMARYYLASIYAGAGRREDAVRELNLVRRSDPVYAKAQAFGAYVQKQAGELTGAERAARNAYEAAPGDVQVVSYLLLILRERENFKEALRICDSAILTLGNDERILYHRGLILHELGRESDALQAMEEVLVANPKNGDALNYIAYALAEEGTDLLRAEKLITEALVIRPDDPYYLDTLGWVYLKGGRLEESNQVLLKAVEKSDGDAIILEHLGDVLVARSQTSEAHKVFLDAYARLGEGRGKDFKDAKKRIEQKLKSAASKR